MALITAIEDKVIREIEIQSPKIPPWSFRGCPYF